MDAERILEITSVPDHWRHQEFPTPLSHQSIFNLPEDHDAQSLVEELGEEWVAIFESARANDGFLVDFLPLSKLD